MRKWSGKLEIALRRKCDNYLDKRRYVMITTVNHNFGNKRIPIRKMTSQLQEVVIKNDVWIGGHCSIFPGTIIPTGSVVAAGAVFTKSSGKDEYSIFAGVPAKKIKERI